MFGQCWETFAKSEHCLSLCSKKYFPTQVGAVGTRTKKLLVHQDREHDYREGKIFQDLLTLYRQNFGAACKDTINSLRNFVKLEECCPVYKETRVIHAVFASDGTSKSMGALLASIMFFHCCDAETALSYLLKKPRAWNPLPLIECIRAATGK